MSLMGHSRQFRDFVLMSVVTPFATKLRASQNDAKGPSGR
jgi:hypothetical protein